MYPSLVAGNGVMRIGYEDGVGPAWVELRHRFLLHAEQSISVGVVYFCYTALCGGDTRESLICEIRSFDRITFCFLITVDKKY